MKQALFQVPESEKIHWTCIRRLDGGLLGWCDCYSESFFLIGCVSGRGVETCAMALDRDGPQLCASRFRTALEFQFQARASKLCQYSTSSLFWLLEALDVVEVLLYQTLLPPPWTYPSKFPSVGRLNLTEFFRPPFCNIFFFYRCSFQDKTMLHPTSLQILTFHRLNIFHKFFKKSSSDFWRVEVLAHELEFCGAVTISNLCESLYLQCPD